MANDDRTKIIPRRTPESAGMLANVKRAMAITANLNRLTFNDADEVRALFSDLIGKKVDGSFCRGVDAGHVPWRKQQSVADQGNKGATARVALAAPTKEDAKIFTHLCAPFQGRGGARSLETGHHRPFPDPQDLSDLSVVGRSWAEVAGGRPSGSRGVLYSYTRVDES